MRKRNIRLQFWVNEKELAKLDKRVRECGLTRQTCFRQRIVGLMPRTTPPPDYYAMMQEIYKMRTVLQAILEGAAVDGTTEIQVNQMSNKLDALVLAITKAVIEPAREV